MGRQPHTEKCRNRFEVLMKDEAKVKNAKRRMEEFEESRKRRKVLTISRRVVRAPVKTHRKRKEKT